MGTLRELGLGCKSGSAALTEDGRVKRVDESRYKSMDYNSTLVTMFDLQAPETIDFEKVHTCSPRRSVSQSPSPTGRKLALSAAKRP